MQDKQNTLSLVKLEDLVYSLESGVRPKGGVDSIPRGIPTLGGEHLEEDGNFNFSSIKFVTEDFFASMKRGIIKKNDILIVKDGATTGKSAFIDEKFPYSKACVNEHVFLLRLNGKLVRPRYVFHYLQSDEGKQKILRSFHGMIGGINSQFVSNVDIPIFSTSKQDKIIEILDRLKLIQVKNRITINKTSELIQSIFSKMFMGQVSNAKDSLPLKDIVIEKPRNGLFKMDSFYGKGVPIVWVEDTSNYILDTSNLRRLELTEKEKEAYNVEEGDILVTRSSHLGVEGVGVMTVADNLSEVIVFESHIIRIKVNTQYVNPFYLAAFFRTNQGRIQIVKRANRGTMTTINQPSLLSLRVPLPPMPKQQKIESLIRRISICRQNQVVLSKQIKKVLLSITHKLFTGKW